MQANSQHQIIPLPFVLLNVESVERKEEENLQKFQYVKNKKSYLDEIRHFSVFEALSFGEKIKI